MPQIAVTKILRSVIAAEFFVFLVRMPSDDFEFSVQAATDPLHRCTDIAILYSFMKRHINIVTGIFAITFLAMHLAATAHGWYETRPFFDKYMHFFGGVFIFFALAMYFLRHIPLPFSGRQLLVLVVFVLAIGILWEGFEYIVQFFTGVLLATPIDSLGDLIFDVFGALTAALMVFATAGFVETRKKRYNEYTQ